MDSKRQSKLPDGLGKKIIQALKAQNAPEAGATGEAIPGQQEMPYEDLPVDEHGLETISHMDFGSQEMHYEQEEAPADYQTYQQGAEPELPNLEAIGDDVDTPQYGSFIEPGGETYPPESFEETIPQAYNEQTYEEYDYNQQSYGEYDYNQQSYQEVAAGTSGFAETQQEEIPEYQVPQLGAPPAEEGTQTEYPQEYEVQEYSDYTTEEYQGASIPDLDTYEQSYEPTEQNQEDYQQPVIQPYSEEEELQIGYNHADLITDEPSYNIPVEKTWEEEQEYQRTIDLDAVEPLPAPQQQYETGARSPLDLDEIDQHPQRAPQAGQPYEPEQYTRPEPQYQQPAVPEERHFQEPVRERLHPGEPTYQEPRREQHLHAEEPFQKEPARDLYRPEERYYQEQARNLHRPEERHYQEHMREYYRPEERYHHEPPREYGHYEERYTPEPARGYYRQEERYHHEPPREYGRYEDRYSPEPLRRPTREEEASYKELPREAIDPGKKGHKPSEGRPDIFNSNVETLIKLVGGLPAGVSRQTGAQIIRQTMEAMGISMTEVLTDAKQAHARLRNYTNESYNVIEEHKILIRRLEDDIHYYHHKAKELDEIINLFVMSEQNLRGR